MPVGIDWAIMLLGNDGLPIPGHTWWTTFFGDRLGNVVSADLDGDGAVEIVGSGVQTLHGLRAAGGFLFEDTFSPEVWLHEPILGNFDSDPELEVASGGHDPSARIFDPQEGEFSWFYSGEFTHFVSLVAGDLNGDGIDELVGISTYNAGVAEDWLHLIDGATRTELPGFPLELGIAHTPYTDLYDLDGDGDLEILVGYGGQLHALTFENTGDPVYEASWPCDRGNTARNGDFHWNRGPRPHFTRGDTNHDADFDLADVLVLARVLFGLEESECRSSLDLNADGRLDLADLVQSSRFQFLGEAEPEWPYPECDSIPRTPDCKVWSCP